MKKRIKALLFKLPTILLLIISFIASIYVVIKKLYPMNWATPIILGIIIVFYFIGEKIANKNELDF